MPNVEPVNMLLFADMNIAISREAVLIGKKKENERVV